MSAELKLPIFNCIGNHDNWGIQRGKAGTTGTEPLYGNKCALKEFGMERAYYTFDDGGWRFIVLDSVRDRGDGGHLPMVDDVVYEGKTYLCNGSMSGSWWHGPHKGCNPGYAIVKLWANGAFSREYVEFEWQ